MVLATKKHSFICDGMLPEWCPDPQYNYILFQRYRKRDVPLFGVWKVNATPGKENEQTAIVVNSNWAAINPHWSPDGKWITFTTVIKSKQAQQNLSIYHGDDLWIVDNEGQQQIQITNNSISEWSPNWARDGRIYFLAYINGKQNVWSIEPPLPEPITTSGSLPSDKNNNSSSAIIMISD